jgi:hypothetical protein
MQTFHVIIHYVSCHHPLYAMSSSTKSHIYGFNRFSVAYSMYITPRVYKRILPCNIFGVTTFTFHFKILFKKFSQQRAGYHLVYKEAWCWGTCGSVLGNGIDRMEMHLWFPTHATSISCQQCRYRMQRAHDPFFFKKKRAQNSLVSVVGDSYICLLYVDSCCLFGSQK